MSLAVDDPNLLRLFNAAVDPMLITDKAGGVVLANPSAATLFGYSQAEMLRLSVEDLIPERFRAAHSMHHQEYLRGARSRPMGEAKVFSGLCKDGAEVPIEISLSPLGGDFVLACVHDVTARQRAEEALRELRAEMQELLELNVASQTAKAIAHEISQPLNALSTYAEAALLMLRGGNPDPARLTHAIEQSVMQAQRAGKVARELLQFLQQGETATEDVDLNRAVRNALAIVESNGFGGFSAELDLEPDLRPVRANRVQVEKVMVNLMRNSVEAMRGAGIPTRSIRIAIRTNSEARMAQVTISDSGPGLDPATAKRIFDPFFTTKPRGIGMGLAVSRSLIEAHGGELWFDTASETGACFHFTLPFST